MLSQQMGHHDLVVEKQQLVPQSPLMQSVFSPRQHVDMPPAGPAPDVFLSLMEGSLGALLRQKTACQGFHRLIPPRDSSTPRHQSGLRGHAVPGSPSHHVYTNVFSNYIYEGI